MARWSAPLLTLCALLAAAAPVVASTSLALDLRELVTSSDRIVMGTVLNREARYDDRRRIVTDVTVRVDESMKGTTGAGDELVIRCLGGEIGDLGMRVAGAPRFSDGQRSILFVAARRGHLRPVGMSQGVLPIDVRDGRELVLPGGEGLSLVRRSLEGRLVPATPALREPRPLPDVLDEIRTLVDETGDR
jgi:hypothetical protein